MGFDDNGLGLKAFVEGAGAAGDAAASSQASDTPADNSKETKAPTDTPKADESAKQEDSRAESSPAKPESSAAAKLDEALKKGGAEDKKSEAAADGKDNTDAAGKDEQAKGINWDTDENPYRQEFAKTQQQLADTRRWSNELNKQNLALTRQLQRLEKKIDGTYDPEEEKRLEEQERRQAAEAEPGADEVANLAELRGATKASLHMAYEQHGKEKTDAAIAEFDKLFQRNPLIMQRVLHSRRPIQEAIKVLSEFRTAQKYGTTDLEALITKVRAEAERELEPKIVERVTKEIMGKLDLKNNETSGIRTVRGSGRNVVEEKLSDKESPKPLSELFPN